MAYVVELSGAGDDYPEEVNDPGVLEEECSVQINAVDIESGIPTFDASDLDHQLERSKSQRLLGKCAIILASYNPLPLLRLALVRAHSRDGDKLSNMPHRKRLTAMDVAHFNEFAPWDGEGQANTQPHVHRRDMVVSNLSSTIQREFRQRVLLALLVYVGAITVLVSACLLCIPWASVQSLMDQSPYLLPVAQAGVTAVAILSLWLVYSLRFDSPINLMALAFFTFGEMACAVAYGVTHGPHGVVQSLSLLLCGILLLRAFASRAATNEDDELLCPAQAAIRSAVVLAAVSVPLNAALGEHATSLTTSGLLGMLGFVAVAQLWVSLVLTVLTQTMTPEEYTSALVFFQANLIVLVIVEPVNVALKHLRRCQRWALHRRRNKEDDCAPASTKPQHNVVVPAFWPDAKVTETSSAAAATSRTASPQVTPLYPAHLIPRRTTRSHSREGQEDDATPAVTTTPAPSPSKMDASLSQLAPAARRRNSTAHE